MAKQELSFAYTGLVDEGLSCARQVAAEPLRSLVELDSGSGMIVFAAGSWNERHGERGRLFSKIARRDQSRSCVWCGAEESSCPKELTLDHLLPRVLGGSYDADNLVLSCRACNSERGALCPRKWSRRSRPGAQPNQAVIQAALARYEQLKDEALALVPTAAMTAVCQPQAS